MKKKQNQWIKFARSVHSFDIRKLIRKKKINKSNVRKREKDSNQIDSLY